MRLSELDVNNLATFSDQLQIVLQRLYHIQQNITRAKYYTYFYKFQSGLLFESIRALDVTNLATVFDQLQIVLRRLYHIQQNITRAKYNKYFFVTCLSLSELDVNNLAIVSDQVLFHPIAISNQRMTNNLTTLAMVFV